MELEKKVNPSSPSRAGERASEQQEGKAEQSRAQSPGLQHGRRRRPSPSPSRIVVGVSI